MNETIFTAIISGIVILLGAFLTARATVFNYMHGASQRDMGDAAGKYADAAGKYADLNIRLTDLNSRLQQSSDVLVQKVTDLEGALARAEEIILTLTQRIENDEESRKGMIMKFSAEINDLKKSLMDDAARISSQALNIEKLLVKSHQLAENFAGVAQESKKKDLQIQKLLMWVESVRNVMKERGLVPPALDLQ